MKIKTTKVVEEEVKITELEKKTVLSFFESKSFYCNSYDCEKLANKIADYYYGDDNEVIAVFNELFANDKSENVPVLEKLFNGVVDLYERSGTVDEAYESFKREFADIWLEYLKEVLSIRKDTATIKKI